MPEMEVFIGILIIEEIIGICFFRIDLLVPHPAAVQGKEHALPVPACVGDIYDVLAHIFCDLKDRAAVVEIFRKHVGRIRPVFGINGGLLLLRGAVRQNLLRPGLTTLDIRERDLILRIMAELLLGQHPADMPVRFGDPLDEAPGKNQLRHKRRKEDPPSNS